MGETVADAFPELSRHDRRPVASTAADVIAALVVFVVLVAPNHLASDALLGMASLPLEVLIGAGLLLLVPDRSRSILATILGAGLGALAVLKVLDLALYAAWDRPFDPILDWSLIGDAENFVAGAIGRLGAIVASVVAAGFAVGLVLGCIVSVRRLSRLLVRHRTAGTAALALLALLWATSGSFAVRVLPGVPLASAGATELIEQRIRQMSADRNDLSRFRSQDAIDPFGLTPGNELLPALRGKDVIVAFVESYGRDAIENPALAPTVRPVIDAGTRSLEAAGFGSESAFLTSPTTGGGSWLAQSTLLSGEWIDSQSRYDTLVAGQRMTLTGAFRRAGWRTVAVMPNTTAPWPESAFFGYDQVYDYAHIGYRGPAFSWATMPDQYALSAFQRLERARPHPPLMAEIALVSSHAPWSPTPSVVDWARVGDGSIFDSMAARRYPPEAILTRPAARVRADYARAAAYSLDTLISYVEKYGGKNLVLVVLGDHEPAPVVTGPNATHDVPVSIVTRDPAVLARIAGWQWQSGLDPDPKAPVWRMDDFRDRFLVAFGSSPTPFGHPR